MMVGDLERAWGASVEATKAAFPAMRARQAGGAAHWLRATQVGEEEGQLRRILRMPTQAQRQLSKAVNKLAAERVEREFEEAEKRGDVAAGWLRQLFTFCRAAGVGEYRRAIPFMADGEMHIAYHEEMLNFVLEFGCLPPLDIRVPDDFGGEEWESRWEDYVACGAAVPEPESRDAWMYYVNRNGRWRRERGGLTQRRGVADRLPGGGRFLFCLELCDRCIRFLGGLAM